jgi:DNA polymerase I-like protein with 3'-5' exonuclease and polymerase domains
MTIHDELIWEGPKRPLEDWLNRIVDLAQHQVPLRCPLDAGMGMSAESWGAMEH